MTSEQTPPTESRPVSLEEARAELAKDKRTGSRAVEGASLAMAVTLGATFAALLAGVFNLAGLTATTLGALLASLATALQAKVFGADADRQKELQTRRLVLRMTLLTSRSRSLTRNEIVDLLEAWGTTGDPELEVEIRERLISEFKKPKELGSG